SEDRPGTVHDRTGMAGGIHWQTTSRAKWPAGGKHRLSLLREGDHLVVAEPEAHARRVVRGRRLCRLGRLGRGSLARDQDDHLAGLVIAQAHLADLPLGLVRLGAAQRGLRRLLRRFDLLGLEHLVQAQEEGLDLGFLTSERQRPPRPGRKEEETALAGLADRGDYDAVDRVELGYRHRQKPTV